MSRRRAVAHCVVELGAADGEVAGGKPQRQSGALAAQGVHQRLAKIQEERVAELVGLALVGRVAAGPRASTGWRPGRSRRSCPKTRPAPAGRSSGWPAASAPTAAPAARDSPPSPASRRADAAPRPRRPPRRPAAPRIRSGVEAVRATGPLRLLEVLLEPVELVELSHEAKRFLERERRLALGPVPLRPVWPSPSRSRCSPSSASASCIPGESSMACWRSSSSRRCSGVRLSSRDWSWADCRASWSRSWSRFCAPGNMPPQRAMKPLMSGSPARGLLGAGAG